MRREYLEQDVYEALQERLKFIFEEFDNIYLSFSGGKDSGLLLNLVLDFQKKHYPEKKIGVFHQDFEAQYTVTTEYVERTFERIKDEVEPYWVCLPMATRTALSSYEMYWYPWDDTKQEIWVRPMPDRDYVINLENNPMTTYRYRMHQEDLAKQFGRWYGEAHGNGRTVCLLGMRADESLQRYSGFLNKKYGYKGECWISRQFKGLWCASPMFDWSAEDVWHANYLFGYDYNHLYDLYSGRTWSPRPLVPLRRRPGGTGCPPPSWGQCGPAPPVRRGRPPPASGGRAASPSPRGQTGARPGGRRASGPQGGRVWSEPG